MYAIRSYYEVTTDGAGNWVAVWDSAENLGGAIADAADLVAHVLAAHRGATVVLVGHSNTVPALVAAAGGPDLCPDTFPFVDGQCRIPDQPGDDQYDHSYNFV